MQDSTFDAIVSDFYRAATGAMEWDRALDRMTAAFSARTVILQTADVRSGQILSMNHGGPPLHDGMLEYVRDYHRCDPRRAALFSNVPAVLGQWWHCHEHFDQNFVSGQRFYNEFLPAYETRYLSTVILAPSEYTMTAFALEIPASRGVLSVDEREIVRRLGEHMREALQSYQRVRALMSQALAGHGLLSSFAYPMWLIDEQRFVSFENAAATRELEQQTRVARRGQHLWLVKDRSNRHLTEQLHLLSRSGHGASGVVDLRTTAADAPTWLHLSALVPGEVFGAFGERPQILATLFDPQHVNALDAFALTNMFDLTPTEAKVAAHMADGLTAAQIGQAHGTSVTTVRSQIRQVITKLGVGRATDVVRLLRQGEALWSSAGGAVRA